RRATLPFGVWMYYWARNAMLQAIYRSERALQLPMRTRKRLGRLAATQERLLGTLGREATVEELAAALERTPREVTDLLLVQAERFTSLDAVGTDGAHASHAEVLRARAGEMPPHPSRPHPPPPAS